MFNIVKKMPKALWIVVLAHGVTDLSAGALLVALPFLKAKFALSYAEVSAIALMQNFTSSVSQPLFGYFSDRSPRPWLMPVGCLLSGVAMVASLLAPHYYLTLLFTAITGLGMAAFHPEAAKTANRLSGKAKGKGVSLFAVGGNGGFAIGSLLLATLLYSNVSTGVLFYILPYALLGIPLIQMTRNLPRPEVKQVGSLKTLRASINWPLLSLLGMVLSRSTVAAGISTFVPLYYVSYLHGSEMYASSLLTVYLATSALGTLFGGAMSDRFGSKRVMLYSILPISILLYLFPIVGDVGAFVVLSCASILLSATFTSSLVLAQKMMPNNVGMASGLTIGLSVGLGAMGVLALGKVADIWGMPVIFTILACLPVVGFVLTLFVEEPEEETVSLVVQVSK
ncbi:MFS transporter [Pelosinus sp. UFO1]|uniref:MFS transporter n=1 Tax=Pelosinus sp. UFO1 TaxID=484770 RepID=UPI0004D147CD|nr:MFS transporter [Pelosinus sp. UFO1]AIF50905.1 major facilitator superfamily MFS_1 [Pelosinus sp. UFO1]